jgi:PilZ domain
MGVLQNGAAVFLATKQVERSRRSGSGKSLAGGRFRAMTSVEHSPRRLERRWATRYSFRAELEIEWGSAILRAKTRDISVSGMFIESNDTLWVGAGFTARLALDHRPVQMDCSVKRVEPGRGMAVTVSVSGDQHKRFQELIASLTHP